MNNSRNARGGNLNNRPATNGTNGNGGSAHGAELLEKIRALGFVKVELELYLDTHPNCRVAQDYYQKTIQELERLTEEYHDTYGPLVASGVRPDDGWSWINEPWPWHRSDDPVNNSWLGEDR